MHPFLRVRNLTKYFGDYAALKDVSFDIYEHEILGLIGPNGAGKTTLMEGICGLLPLNQGTISVDGRQIDPSLRKDLMFYLPDGITPYGDQKVGTLLQFVADIFSQKQHVKFQLIEALALQQVLEKKIINLSKGFKRRVLLALALLTSYWPGYVP